MSVSIDHIFSITIALVGGIIWAKWGYQMVFALGAGIALINLVSAQFIRIPETNTGLLAVEPPENFCSTLSAANLKQT
jgi:hypothetical protein